MPVDTLQTIEPGSVKSMTLEQLAEGRYGLAWPETRFAGMVRLARNALIAWGAVSLGATIGMGYFYLTGPADGLRAGGIRAPAAEAPASTRLSLLLDAAPMSESPAADFAPVAAQAPARPAIASTVMPPASEPGAFAAPDAPLADARLPRARPGDPIVTGSIPRRATYNPKRFPVWGRPAPTPCVVLRDFGAQVRCTRQARYYAPPPPPPVVPLQARDYYPRPYQPPVYSTN